MSLMEEKKSNLHEAEGVACIAAQRGQFDAFLLILEIFLVEKSCIFFFSLRGHPKKRGNGEKVESIDEQHVEAGKQKEEVEHQVGDGQVGQVGVDVDDNHDEFRLM